MASFLVDANVLLDGCFVDISWSARCLNDALRVGNDLYVTDLVIQEARERISSCLSCLRDPNPYFVYLSERVRELDIGTIDDSEGECPEIIPRNDRYLWPTAEQRSLTLLTRDLACLKAFRLAGKEALTPLEVITDSEPAHRYLFGGVAPTHDAGTLYFQGMNSARQSNIDVPVNVFHFGNDFFLDYIPNQRTWRVSGAAVSEPVEYRLRSPFNARQIKKVVVTWRDGMLRIFDSSQDHPSDQKEVHLCPFSAESQIQVGELDHTRIGGSSHIQAIIFDNRGISLPFWRNIRNEGPAFTQQPFDNDRLCAQIRRLNIQLAQL